MNQVLIYTSQTTKRLSYIFDFMLGDLLGLQYEFTTDKEKFTASTLPKFSYAANPLADEFFFESASLLFETKVELQPIDFREFEDIVGFYPVSEKSLIPFDIFASAFLMITCYNEYLINKKDKYDRYRSSQNMNYKAGFLDKPMVNYYALELKKLLGKRYPELVFKKNKFEYVATFDVDMAFSYLEKGLKINTAGFLRSFILSDFEDIKNRYQVLFGRKKDPFDNYKYILDVCGEYEIKNIFFFLLGDRSTFDKNIPYTNKRYREVIQSLAAKTDVGIHLSFRSHISNDVMREELERLEEITDKPVRANRFHYLRFTIPASYLRLIKIGIKDEYSLSFPTRAGFRAGTCNPFYFFNLLKNEKTDLKIHPFAFMDTTFTHYNKRSAEDSVGKILQLMKYVQEVGGPFIGLWHNSSFGEEKEWVGWRSVFETVAREARALMNES